MTAPIDYAEVARRVNARLMERWKSMVTSPCFTPEDVARVLSGEGAAGVSDLIREIAAEVEAETGGGE